MTRIIAECCQNHNGDLELLKDMVVAAAEAGATYVKMQTIYSEDLTHRPRFDTGDGKTCINRPFEPEFERMQGLDLPDDAHEVFVQTCLDNGVLPMTTVFNHGRLAMVRKAGFTAVKVASYDCASFPLLRALRDSFDFLVVSTGATYDPEILKAADLLKNTTFAFLHCVTSYPTTLDMLHLNRMKWLRQHAPLVGFSDHSHTEKGGITAAKAAIWQGADYVERHYTILKADETKDGPVSIRPEHIRELVEFSKLSKSAQEAEVRSLVGDIEPLMGQAQREMSETELLNRDYYRGRFATKVDGQVVYNWEEMPS
jgi:N,N'-diacetyllegionaminate synthase